MRDILIAGLPPKPGSPLSKRELRILAYFLESGCSDKVMADHFKLQYNTIKVHMSHIRIKLGVRNRSQLLIACGKRDPPPAE